MKAAVFCGNENVQVMEVPDPAVPKGGAVVRVKCAGICGTDKRIYQFGHFRIPPGGKRILGHELSAEIVELDQGVAGYHIGDRVTFAPNIGCGTCRQCRKGFHQLCDDYDAFGISLDGGFAEYMAVPEKAFVQGNVFHLNEDFDWDEGAMVEISACAYRGLAACKPGPDDSVLIIGGGVVTYMMVKWARYFGVQPVIVSVIEDDWGRLSDLAGPDKVINSTRQDLKEAVFDLTHGDGADIVIAACSVKSVDEMASSLAAKQGRVNFFGGLPKEHSIISINSRDIHYREVTITGTTGANVGVFGTVLDILTKKPFDLKEVITHRYELDHADQAFAYSAGNDARLKTMIHCDPTTRRRV